MRRAIVLVCGAMSACSFVVGTNKYVLGGDAGDDVTLNEAGGDDASTNDVVVQDAGNDVFTCSIAGCLAEAGVCGANCGVTRASCVSNCSNQPCKNNCMTAETACRTACGATCNACTLGAGCEDKVACADAAAM